MQTIKAIAIVALFSSLLVGRACAELKLPSVFSDHMVLQREIEAPIWGTAAPGEKITIKLGGKSVTALAAADGRWSAKLPAMQAGGPHEISILGASGETKVLKDVLFGEVWLCSGQSNMERIVFGQGGQKPTPNVKEEMAAANYPYLRMFNTTRVQNKVPQTDCPGAWAVCTPASVAKFSAVGYFFARDLQKALNIPIGILHSSWGGTRIEPWTPGGAGSTLYNAMIHPLAPYGLRGFTWYQGESNMGDGMGYAVKMKSLISSWRNVWGKEDLPFYYVQLAPFRYRKNLGLPELWAAQTATLSVPYTGMAVITDVSDVNDIHPINKQEVGRRLALLALAKDYGKKNLVYSGPLYKSLSVEGAKIRLRFDHVAGGLASRDGKPLSHFTLAGDDGNFVPAEARIEGDSVVVQAAAVTAPKNVRFGWAEDAEPNFINREGLPASPFRTDGWTTK